jgi:diguanylate cyclase (GGDEF)-like protein
MPNDSSTASIAPLLGEFTCATTETGFLHQQTEAILRDLRRAMVLCSLFYVLFSVADLMALGLPGATMPMLARLSMPLAALAGLRHIGRAANQVRAAHAVSSVFTLLGMASYMIVICYRPQDTLLHGMSVSLMAAVILIFIPNRLRSACAIALGASLAFIGLAWYLHTETTRHLVTMTMLILFANGFGVIAANRQARLWREQYWAQQVLKNLSVRDPLTGCYNRRHLNAALLDSEIARARRYRLDLSLIMCDLDGFKAINDTYGHPAGDELLRAFAALLQAMTRDSVDTVVRYGGEEFLIILPETRLDGASELAERIRAAFAVQRTQVATPIGTLEVSTTASFGVVSIDFGSTQAVTPQALIAAADELMYDAKRAGRNRVHAHQLTPQIGQLA